MAQNNLKILNFIFFTVKIEIKVLLSLHFFQEER
jgi:hypothetical protein